MTDEKKIDVGGQAFPEGGVLDGDRNQVNPIGAYFDAGGMTVRDYMAAHVDISEPISVTTAMMVTRRNLPDTPHYSKETMLFWADARAALRYMEADAMIRARKRCYD
jgi:hypothetical protein